jgi:hypothetical protein
MNCRERGSVRIFYLFLSVGEWAMSDDRNTQAAMDANTLYLEEMFTDRKVGALRRMTPVQSDGQRDLARPILYVGQAEIMTNMGAIPINFEIEATTLAQAVAGFGAAAATAVERTAQQIQEMRRQQASQLVVPQGGMGGIPAPGRGKIQIP